jgi:hypothetical protein
MGEVCVSASGAFVAQRCLHASRMEERLSLHEQLLESLAF